MKYVCLYEQDRAGESRDFLAERVPLLLSAGNISTWFDQQLGSNNPYVKMLNYTNAGDAYIEADYSTNDKKIVLRKEMRRNWDNKMHTTFSFWEEDKKKNNKITASGSFTLVEDGAAGEFITYSQQQDVNYAPARGTIPPIELLKIITHHQNIIAQLGDRRAERQKLFALREDTLSNRARELSEWFTTTGNYYQQQKSLAGADLTHSGNTMTISYTDRQDNNCKISKMRNAAAGGGITSDTFQLSIDGPVDSNTSYHARYVIQISNTGKIMRAQGTERNGKKNKTSPYKDMDLTWLLGKFTSAKEEASGIK